jgi:phospholipid transport system substrate-binding protein
LGPKRQTHIALPLLLLAFWVGHSWAAAIVPDPARETRTMVRQVLAIMHNTGMSPEQRRRELIGVAESKFDLATMARGALGSHWNELSPAQRERFVSLFAAFIEDAYFDKIQDYASLHISVNGENFADRNHASVNASVAQPGQDEIAITFKLELRGTDWAVYDVVIEDVGMIENYRAQFDRVIRTYGIARLMTDLENKQSQLGARLGDRRGSS